MLSQDEEVDVEVRWADQQNIIEFGKLNVRLTELTDDAKAEKVRGWTCRVAAVSWASASWVEAQGARFFAASASLRVESARRVWG